MSDLRSLTFPLPQRHECPRDFCFHWEPIGTRSIITRPGDGPPVFSSLEEALQCGRWSAPRLEPGCGCDFGVCTRLDPDDGDRDWYEPHEPNLDHAGLPHDFFRSARDADGAG